MSSFGFQHFIMSGLPAFGQNVEDFVICNRWPTEWTNRFRERDYFKDDPVSLWSFKTTSPFKWSDARQRMQQTDGSIAIQSEAAAFGLVDGLGFPMCDLHCWQSIVSVATDMPIQVGSRLLSLFYLAALMCQMNAVGLSPAPTHLTALTLREREILSWIAAGKSYWETSVILSISIAPSTQPWPP